MTLAFKFDPGYLTSERECHFCGAKQSVKYIVVEVDGTDTVISDKMQCCNSCLFRHPHHLVPTTQEILAQM